MNKKKLDNYYQQALVIAKLSPDEETQVGSLLIKKDSGAVIGCSYNGFIKGAPDHKLPKTRPLKYPYIQHSEMNLIFHAALHGISIDNCFVFCTLSPCINCCRALYQCNVKEIYFKNKYNDFDTQLNMLDINLNLSEEHGYYKIKLEAASND